MNNTNTFNVQSQQQVTLSPELEHMLLIMMQKQNTQTKFEEPKQQHIKKSKFTSTGKPKAQAAEPIRSLEDIKRIQNYFLNKEKYRDFMMFTVGISVGLRISDLLSLRFSDVMYDDYTFKPYIDIVEQKTDKETHTALDDCVITKSVRDAIELYMCSLEHKPDMNDYLFPSQKGNNLDTRSAHKILKQMSRDLELPYNVGTHSLRKTLGYWTIKLNPNNNNALIGLQAMYHHSSERTTLGYTGITKDETRAFRNKLSDFYESDK